MTDTAASALPDLDRHVGDGMPPFGARFCANVDIARAAFAADLGVIASLSPAETDAVLGKFDDAVLEIATAMVEHLASTKAPPSLLSTGSLPSLRLVRGESR